jgi:hypothetical protein
MVEKKERATARWVYGITPHGTYPYGPMPAYGVSPRPTSSELSGYAVERVGETTAQSLAGPHLAISHVSHGRVGLMADILVIDDTQQMRRGRLLSAYGQRPPFRPSNGLSVEIFLQCVVNAKEWS